MEINHILIRSYTLHIGFLTLKNIEINLKPHYEELKSPVHRIFTPVSYFYNYGYKDKL